MKKLLGYFFQGLLLGVPIVLTVYIIVTMFITVDEVIPYHPFPGSGVIIIVVTVTLIGVLGNTIIAQKLRQLMHFTMLKLPLLNTIYTAIKELMSAFVGEKKKFNRPVLVQVITGSNIKNIGFVTQDDLTSLNLSKDKIAVYLPHSYAISGVLVLVDRENVTPLNAKSAEVMKFIVSGGVAIPGSLPDKNEN